MSMTRIRGLVLVLMTTATWRRSFSFVATRTTTRRRIDWNCRRGYFPTTRRNAEVCKYQRETPTRRAKNVISFRRISSAVHLSVDDEQYLQEAIEHAKLGVGHTFPNPAVGCVIVVTSSTTSDSSDTWTKVIGRGFHPKAGYPHAEIFAMLEAAGHVPNGVEAAQSVIGSKNGMDSSSVEQLTQQYIDQGPQSLFENCLQQVKADSGDATVTAYVTLEPCCHSGKMTPPCASTLAMAGVDRVVVGYRDPNPRVDGGGVQFLREAGIEVDLATGAQEQACCKIITNFCKRITPPLPSYEFVTGAMRSSLRTLAAQRKHSKTLKDVSWGGASVSTGNDSDGSMEELVDQLVLQPEWMEHLDDILWREELVLVRLNTAVAKRRYVKRLGDRIASILQAHVAQSVGHTVLLYRPGKPPTLNLHQL